MSAVRGARCGARSALAREMRWNFGVKKLSLAFCDIGAAGAEALRDDVLVPRTTRVEQLILSGNPLQCARGSHIKIAQANARLPCLSTPISRP